MPESQIPALPSPWVKVEELAAMLGVEERYIWTLVANGGLPEPRRVGRGRWTRWPREQVEQLLAEWRIAGFTHPTSLGGPRPVREQ